MKPGDANSRASNVSFLTEYQTQHEKALAVPLNWGVCVCVCIYTNGLNLDCERVSVFVFLEVCIFSHEVCMLQGCMSCVYVWKTWASSKAREDKADRSPLCKVLPMTNSWVVNSETTYRERQRVRLTTFCPSSQN